MLSSSSSIVPKILVYGLILLILLCLTISFTKTFELMGHHETHIAQESFHHVAMGGKSVGMDPLEHEMMFVDTLKDCIPRKETKKECKTFIIPNQLSSEKERVAVLAPPGKTTKMLLKFIDIILMKGMKGKDAVNAKTLIEILPETHMAPYGYGATHGYTRIIRAVPQPLLLGATDTLKAAVELLPSSLSINDITLNDLKASLRQQVRYHCRLNHIAAHTAMWTIGLEDFAEIDRDLLVENAREFFDLNSQENLINEVIDEYEKVSNNDDDKVMRDDDDNALVRLNGMYAEGESLLNLIQITDNKNKSNYNNNILKILDDVLLDEMKISKNLTAWPCESFWTVGEPEDRLNISPIIRSISKAMSPNCTKPHTSCFVKRDKCEFKGDGRCK